MENGVSILSENLKTYKRFTDERGFLGVIEDRDIPFQIKRVFWIRDVPEGQTRGHHSHRECEQLIVCLNGVFNVQMDREFHRLSIVSRALYVPVGSHIILSNFSSSAVCLVLASEYYNAGDYVR